MSEGRCLLVINGVKYGTWKCSIGIFAWSCFSRHVVVPGLIT